MPVPFFASFWSTMMVTSTSVTMPPERSSGSLSSAEMGSSKLTLTACKIDPRFNLSENEMDTDTSSLRDDDEVAMLPPVLADDDDDLEVVVVIDREVDSTDEEEDDVADPDEAEDGNADESKDEADEEDDDKVGCDPPAKSTGDSNDEEEEDDEDDDEVGLELRLLVVTRLGLRVEVWFEHAIHLDRKDSTMALIFSLERPRDCRMVCNSRTTC